MKKTDSQAVADFIGNLFRVRDVVHLFHLKTKSHIKHIISEEFYTAFLDQIDDFAETYQGDSGLRLDITIKESQTFDDINTILDTLKEIILSAKPLVNAPLQSILDDMYNLTSKTLYKLNNE